jgi:hypothetical protein
LFLNQFLRESRYKIICKLYEEETIFISAFKNSNWFCENFMKIGFSSLYFVDEWFLYFVNKVFFVYFVDKMVFDTNHVI